MVHTYTCRSRYTVQRVVDLQEGVWRTAACCALARASSARAALSSSRDCCASSVAAANSIRALLRSFLCNTGQRKRVQPLITRNTHISPMHQKERVVSVVES